MRPVVQFALVGLLAVCRTFACSCGDSPPCAKVGPDSVVFVGRVIRNTDSWFGSKPRPVRFFVERSFRGIPRNTHFVDVDSSAAPSCEASFKTLERYLVYAFQTSDGRIGTSSCRGSVPIKDASNDLRYLEELVAGKAASFVAGDVYADAEPPFLEGLRLRLSEAVVSIKGANGFFKDVHPDEAGRFSVPAPAGIYRISAHASGLRSQREERSVVVTEGACGLAYFAIGFDGHVKGVVREAGSPLRDPIKIQLLPVHENDRYSSPIDTMSTSIGEFEFERVGPGKYLLGVNLDQFNQPDTKVPFATTYYPGVHDREAATLLSLHPSETLANLVLNLPPRVRTRQINVRVVWEDRTPADTVHVWCAPTGVIPWQHVLTDRAGRITFPAMDRIEYIIGAASASDYAIADRRSYSAPAVSVPPGSDATVILVLSPPKKK